MRFRINILLPTNHWRITENENIICKYNITNVFLSETEVELKHNINKKIRNLCITDIEKTYILDYNIDIAFNSSISNLTMYNIF